MNQIKTLNDGYPTEAKRLRVLIVITAMLFAIGIVAPIITLNKWVVFENTFSIASGVFELIKNGQFFLFVIISGFSILLPVLKIHVLYKIVSKSTVNQNRLSRYIQLMHHYGRWSMLDVLVVAILVVSVKLGAIAEVETRFGLYVFAAAVLIMMLITARVCKLLEGLNDQAT